MRPPSYPTQSGRSGTAPARRCPAADVVLQMAAGLALLALAGAPVRGEPGFVTGVIARSDGADFHQHTTPQVARLGDGRLLAVMGVRAKGASPLSRIGAAVSMDGGRGWSPVRVLHEETAQDRFSTDPNLLVDGDQVFVYWTRVERPNSIERSWIWARHSPDNGVTWSQPREIAVPRRYTVGKQHNAIRLADGSYAMGISWDRWPERGYHARTEGETSPASGILLSKDGLTWNLFGDLHALVEKVTPGAVNGLVEPAIVQLADGSLYMLLRSGSSRHFESRSRDGGVTWDPPQPSPLVGHNSPSALWRVEPAGNEILALWNNSPVRRLPLSAALSADGGRTWPCFLQDPGELLHAARAGLPD